MIIDTPDRLLRHYNLEGPLLNAVEWIRAASPGIVTPGKHVIDGDEIFALVSEYITKDRTACRLEAHRRYIDLQFLLSGSELFGYAPLGGQTPAVPYDEAKDNIFYEGEASFIRLEPGVVVIAFPGDCHMPGVRSAGPAPVKKVVVKVKT